MCKIFWIVMVLGFGLVASMLASCTQVTVRPGSGSSVTVKPVGDGQLEVGVEGRTGKPSERPAAGPAPDASSGEARRAELESRVQQLGAARASLEDELNRLGSKTAETARLLEEADKELTSRKDAAETATRRLAELQRAVNEMAQRNSQDAQVAKTMTEQIAAAEAKMAMAEADRQRVEEGRGKLIAERDDLAEEVKADSGRLAAVRGALAEAAKQREALADQASAAEHRRSVAEAAAAEATDRADRATADFQDVQSRISEANARLAAVTCEVTDGERKVQRLAASQDREVRQPTPLAAPAGTPNMEVVAPSPNPWPFVGIFVAVVIGAIVVVMFAFRKPTAYTFTLLDEDSKISHGIHMTAVDRVDLNGAQPIKKAGTKNSRAPFLTISRKGEIVLHPMSGFLTKLNDLVVNFAETPTVKPGAVVEVTANGQTNRFLVGPVSTADRNPKVVVKSPVASVRPA
jgi:multidrug efflux pump subunit AcrA (membrane-fusion protein)